MTTSAAFGALKQADAGVLSAGYAQDGPADGPPVLLLHGWPYDIHSFAEVSPVLASAGYRVIVPFVRGYGTTNGAPHPEPSAYAGKFTGKYQHRVIGGGVGHNLPQEAPQAFAKAIIDADRWFPSGVAR